LTTQFLAALKDKSIKATFYVTGAKSISNPDIIKAEFDAGHGIAIHTWTHHPLTSLTNEQVIAELLYTEAFIYKTIGKAPRQYRPPYGDVDDRTRAIASALGFTAALWSHEE
jgi:peptidoglycan/xylan/chitin deacetylase (PgdA/CDA1 family)